MGLASKRLCNEDMISQCINCTGETTRLCNEEVKLSCTGSVQAGLYTVCYAYQYPSLSFCIILLRSLSDRAILPPSHSLLTEQGCTATLSQNEGVSGPRSHDRQPARFRADRLSGRSRDCLGNNPLT